MTNNTFTNKRITPFEQIQDFVQKYPRAWQCDLRLHGLKTAETLRNFAESYSEMNSCKIPTYHEITEYWESVEAQILADLAAEIWISGSKGHSLSNGLFSKLSIDRDDVKHTTLICGMPLILTGIVQHDDDYVIRYLWLNAPDSKPANEFLTFVNTTMKLNGAAKQAFAEFIYALIRQANDRGMIDDEPSPISVGIDGKITVNYEVAEMDPAMIIESLRDFYANSTNPKAYLSAFAYALTGPLHYYIRKFSPPEFLMRLHVSYGITGSGKTTTDALFTLHGYAQRKEQGILNLEQIRTGFTLAHNLGNSTLPVIINDVSGEWLEKFSEQLKNMSESNIASDRGRPDQTINRRELKRSIFITLNQEIAPGDDAARARRYILESYNKDNLQRQDKMKYNAFMDSLPYGFMFRIFNEIYADQNIYEVIKEITQTTVSTDFINYGLEKINDLCKKYGAEPFPAYKDNQVLMANGPAGMLCEWFIDQWNRLNTLDLNGRVYAPYPEVSATELHVREDNGIYTVFFTGAAYKIAKNKLGLRFNSATDLLNNIVDDPVVKVVFSFKNHKFAGTSLKAFCLEYRGGGSDEIS